MTFCDRCDKKVRKRITIFNSNQHYIKVCKECAPYIQKMPEAKP